MAPGARPSGALWQESAKPRPVASRCQFGGSPATWCGPVRAESRGRSPRPALRREAPSPPGRTGGFRRRPPPGDQATPPASMGRHPASPGHYMRRLATPGIQAATRAARPMRQAGAELCLKLQRLHDPDRQRTPENASRHRPNLGGPLQHCQPRVPAFGPPSETCYSAWRSSPLLAWNELGDCLTTLGKQVLHHPWDEREQPLPVSSLDVAVGVV